MLCACDLTVKNVQVGAVNPQALAAAIVGTGEGIHVRPFSVRSAETHCDVRQNVRHSARHEKERVGSPRPCHPTLYMRAEKELGHRETSLARATKPVPELKSDFRACGSAR